MRAAVYRRFGGPEVVRVEQVPRPSVGRHDVLPQELPKRYGDRTAVDGTSSTIAHQIPRQGGGRPSAAAVGLTSRRTHDRW